VLKVLHLSKPLQSPQRLSSTVVTKSSVDICRYDTQHQTLSIVTLGKNTLSTTIKKVWNIFFANCGLVACFSVACHYDECHYDKRRARYQKGDNTQVVWTEFATLRKAKLVGFMVSAWHTYGFLHS
jgi:hypothetical protein